MKKSVFLHEEKSRHHHEILSSNLTLIVLETQKFNICWVIQETVPKINKIWSQWIQSHFQNMIIAFVANAYGLTYYFDRCMHQIFVEIGLKYAVTIRYE